MSYHEKFEKFIKGRYDTEESHVQLVKDIASILDEFLRAEENVKAKRRQEEPPLDLSVLEDVILMGSPKRHPDSYPRENITYQKGMDPGW